MKANIGKDGASPNRHAKRLDRSIQVLIVYGVFIMPDAGRWIGNFVNDEGTPIDSRFRFDCDTGCSRPRAGGRSHSNGGTNRGESEATCPGYVISAIRRIVIHVALTGMRLTPSILLRTVILDLSVIGRAAIQRGIQVGSIDQNPM